MPVVPGRTWNFPRDHGAHPDFKTEWWYFTGHLETAEGRRFGFQWTVFRSALLKPGEARAGGSAWRARDLYFGHLAIGDLQGKKFYYAESAARGALDLAGSSPEELKVWLPDFAASLQEK
jgi:Predicted secreted hydrolase